MNEYIDISIVTYNSKKWMDSFFESLIKQTYPQDKMHIYITDNSSTDDTYTYLELLEQKYTKVFASINLKKEKNLGFGHGHNNNFKHASSKFILVTNVDLEFEKDSIIRLCDFAQKDDKRTASWEMRQKPYEHPKYYNPVTLETSWSSSACILFRKKAIDNIGGYEKKIFMYGEDVEISYRLRDNGYILKYYPKSVCWHYTYETANQVKELQFLGSTSSNILLRLRYGSIRDIIKGFILYIGLFFLPKSFESQRRGLFKNFFSIIKKTPYFLFSRRKNKNNTYKFLLWDYEFIRDGAFYTHEENLHPKSPLVSVIVRTCCQRLDYLKEAIESIKGQTYNNIELVIVEDGTDDAQDFESSIKSHNIKHVNYVSMPKAGRCIGGNVGLNNATGEYMIFLDDDDLFFADHLEVLVSEIEQNPNISACYTSAFQVATKIESKTPLKYQEMSHDVIYRQEFSRCFMWYNNYIPIQSILFSRKLYDTYGGFDEELDNLEDWNLWTRYSLENDFKYIPKTTSLYRVPYHHTETKKRQEELDSYYQKALEKQKELKLNMSPTDVISCYHELNTSINLIHISKDHVKSMFSRIPLLYRFYHFSKKVYHKIKRRN